MKSNNVLLLSQLCGNLCMLKVLNSIKSIRREVISYHRKNLKIGFVPTMGALHKGHLKLVEESVNETDITIVSIFVNPTQFNDSNDLKNYPRDILKDKILLKESGCHILFNPSPEEIYPNKPETQISFGKLEKEMEGKYREGHFNGVALVVSKLLNIVQPDIAYFGQKDWQQYIIIKRLSEDLNFNSKIKFVPTVRETNGLAMSSRNQRLTSDLKEKSAVIYDSLKKAKKLLRESNDVKLVKEFIETIFADENQLSLEYFEVIEAYNLDRFEDPREVETIVLAIAVYADEVRLIDNVLLELN
ncbi:MAG: pantoate--beta-alanine ligase [Bacteroidota bacterium]